MKTMAKPIPADASLSLGKTTGYWALVHDGTFDDRSCHPNEGGICRAKLRPDSWLTKQIIILRFLPRTETEEQ